MAKPYSPSQVVKELKDQLSSEKRKLSFLFGAGSSMSVGIPGIIELTKKIEKSIDVKFSKQFEELKNACGKDGNTIEVILNRLRTIRDLIDESETEIYHNIKGKTFARELDVAICAKISEFVSKTSGIIINSHLDFANWIFRYQNNRINPVELFTTNYDLLFEEAFEERKIPYFDGFVGSINPFIIPECIEAENTKQYSHVYIPNSWLRLWKIHGSINWFLYKDTGGKNRITRKTGKVCKAGEELMIFPSRQKYDESRRLPFLLFQDRLRKYLSQGEILLIINGYSFCDEHINEILFQSLRANKRLAVTALLYGELKGTKRLIPESVLKYGLENPNLTILGPDQASIGGNISSWEFDGTPITDDFYWNEVTKTFELGDFSIFSKFLKESFYNSI
jgi:hypothetical protein